ncbi:hypothetical protein BDB01DRAFT_456193 [Pilobolus umbonatus]|nr:hypothetical protein BDB01DRAFT_456193 [Pilobolus umbonatus]
MPLKYTMETEPHTDPLSRVEIEKRPKSTLQKSSSYPDQQSSKWIKKSASDVNLREKVLLFGIHDKRRSVTPPPARPMKHDSVEYSSSSLDEKSPYGLQPPPRHNARSYCESNSSGECESMPTDDDFKSFMSTPYGLPPPPRPTLKPKSNRKSFKSDEGSESSQYLDIFPSNLGSSSPSSSAMSEYFDYLSSESEKPTYSDTVTDHYIKSELPPLPKSEPLFSISSINMNGSKEQYAQYEGSDEEDLAYTRGYI